jgi:hypothetical protein
VWLVAVGTAACGPTQIDAGSDESGDATGAGAGTHGSDATSDPSGDPLPGPGDSGFTEDEQRCIDLCTNLQGSDCGRADASCYTWCLARIGEWAPPGCESVESDVVACEAGHPIDAGCEATACDEVYRRADLCQGWCGHLDGSPYSGASPEECNWGSSCYGHEFEAVCTTTETASSTCSCQVDGEEIDQCDPPAPIGSFECDEAVGVFTTCCGEAFTEVLLP